MHVWSTEVHEIANSDRNHASLEKAPFCSQENPMPMILIGEAPSVIIFF